MFCKRKQFEKMQYMFLIRVMFLKLIMEEKIKR